MINYVHLKSLILLLIISVLPVLLQANTHSWGHPPGPRSGVQDSTENLLGHCQPIIRKTFNCAEGTIELEAFVIFLFTGQTLPQVVLWSTGETAHKITVSPPGTWSWDASNTGCEVYHYNTSFSLETLGTFPLTTPPQLIEPANGATGTNAYTRFIWKAIANAVEYRVEVATDPSFSPASLFTVMTVADTNVLLTPVPGNFTVYYWRVKALNYCSESDFSPVYAFQSGQPQCNQAFLSVDVPASFQEFPDGTYKAISNLDIPVFREMVDVNVLLDVRHPRTGDLSASLISPQQDTILLFDRPGVPASPDGCTKANGDLIFDDQASQAAAVLEAQCNNTPPALKGTFKPIGSLGTLNGSNVQGQWQMLLTDNNPGLDSGFIHTWKLTFCLTAAIPPGVLSANFPLYVVTAESDTITQQLLQFQGGNTPASIRYTLLDLPMHGTLLLNGTPLAVNANFTQLDIDLGRLLYSNNGDTATADAFRFDVIHTPTGAWLHNQIFNIIILPEPFSASAAISQSIVCPGGLGEITVQASGLGGVYTYSINGGPAQNSPVFYNLPEGAYVATVVSSPSGISITTLPVNLVGPPIITIVPTLTCDRITLQTTAAVPPVQYSIDGGPLQAENHFIDLSNGTHILFVQDSMGCVASDTVLVSYLPLDLSAEIVAPKCHGEQNGKITISLLGGQMPFMYKLNGGQSQSSGVFNNLSAGIYELSISDNQGCSASTSVQVIDPAMLQITAGINWNNISIQASGGTGNYVYSLDAAPFQADSQFLNVLNGNHTLRVRDENGCIASMQVLINVLSGTVQGAKSICAGDLLTLTIQTSGGLAPYEYQLNGGGFQPSNIFNNLGPGIYTVSIRDFSGTEIVLNPFECIEYPNPSVQVTTHCDEASIAITGGTPPYISNPSGTHLTDLPNGIYPVSVTDAKGCRADTSFEIAAPLITTTSQTVDVICYGDSTGSATIDVMGGSAPYLYSLLGGPYQSENYFDSLPGGWFYYSVQDSDGCAEEFNFSILQPDSLGLMTMIIGSTIIADATGGTGSHKYRLNNGPEQNSGVFEQLALGTYFVTARDELQCSVTSEDLAIVTIGTVELTESWSAEVWPNPSNGQYRLLLRNAPDILRADVYAVSGQLLQGLELRPENGSLQTTLHLENFPDGVYLLRLTDGSASTHVYLYKY